MKNMYEHRVIVATGSGSSTLVSNTMNEMSGDGYDVYNVEVTPLADSHRANVIVTSVTFRLRDETSH